MLQVWFERWRDQPILKTKSHRRRVIDCFHFFEYWCDFLCVRVANLVSTFGHGPNCCCVFQFKFRWNTFIDNGNFEFKWSIHSACKLLILFFWGIYVCISLVELFVDWHNIHKSQSSRFVLAQSNQKKVEKHTYLFSKTETCFFGGTIQDLGVYTKSFRAEVNPHGVVMVTLTVV